MWKYNEWSNDRSQHTCGGKGGERNFITNKNATDFYNDLSFVCRFTNNHSYHLSFSLSLSHSINLSLPLLSSSPTLAKCSVQFGHNDFERGEKVHKYMLSWPIWHIYQNSPAYIEKEHATFNFLTFFKLSFTNSGNTLLVLYSLC